MMGLSLFIGYLQIHIALVLNAVNKIRLRAFGAAIRPLADMLIITGAIAMATHLNAFNLNISVFKPFGLPIGQIPLMIPFVVTQGMFFAGLILFIVFDEWGQPFFKKFGWSLFNLYLFVSGALGNLLSYMRLFALGLSSSMLGLVFNSLAFGLITKDGILNPASPMIIGTVLLLLVGHTLNFGLAILGSFVHPMRLTFLEFFSTIGFKGNGRPYRPLSDATK
jgi:V/A-type H+-transporting ATPase subunit I